MSETTHEPLVACMGGWCHLRGHCPHHHAEDRSAPSERLCHTGRDGDSAIVNVNIVRQSNAERMPSQQVSE